MSDLRVLVDDIVFPEGLCWHDGELWFSDFGTRRVFSVTPAGERRERAYVPGQPSGIGFRPDGAALVVSMMDHLLIRLGAEHAAIEADLTAACVGPANDMIVDRRGRTYFGAFGYDPAYEGGDALRPSALSMVSESGEITEVADELSFPNGMAITADAGTLVVAETFGGRLTAFAVAADGSLSGRRVFADSASGRPMASAWTPTVPSGRAARSARSLSTSPMAARSSERFPRRAAGRSPVPSAATTAGPCSARPRTRPSRNSTKGAPPARSRSLKFELEPSLPETWTGDVR